MIKGRKGGITERRKDKLKAVTSYSSLETFLIPRVAISAFCLRHGSIPFPAPSISHSPEGQPTEVYISRTFAWLPELGMLKRPRRASFRLPNFGSSPTHKPEEAGRSAQIPGREQTGRNYPTPAEGATQGSPGTVGGSAGSATRRARRRPASDAARESAAPREPARPSEGALSEGTSARERALGVVPRWREGREGRAEAGPRRREDAELCPASPGCGATTGEREGGSRCARSLKTGISGALRDASSGTRPWGRAARRCVLLRFPRSV